MRNGVMVGVAVEVVSVYLALVIACGVFPYWRVMDFRRWSCLDQPDAQVIEDVPYYLVFLDEADDPLARTDDSHRR